MGVQREAFEAAVAAATSSLAGARASVLWSVADGSDAAVIEIVTDAEAAQSLLEAATEATARAQQILRTAAMVRLGGMQQQTDAWVRRVAPPVSPLISLHQSLSSSLALAQTRYAAALQESVRRADVAVTRRRLEEREIMARRQQVVVDAIASADEAWLGSWSEEGLAWGIAKIDACLFDEIVREADGWDESSSTMARFADHVKGLLETQMLATAPDAQPRVLKMVIGTAHILLNVYRDLNGVAAFHAALTSPQITSRFKKAWDSLTAPARDAFRRIESVCGAFGDRKESLELVMEMLEHHYVPSGAYTLVPNLRPFVPVQKGSLEMQTLTMCFAAWNARPPLQLWNSSNAGHADPGPAKVHAFEMKLGQPVVDLCVELFPAQETGDARILHWLLSRSALAAAPAAATSTATPVSEPDVLLNGQQKGLAGIVLDDARSIVDAARNAISAMTPSKNSTLPQAIQDAGERDDDAWSSHGEDDDDDDGPPISPTLIKQALMAAQAGREEDATAVGTGDGTEESPVIMHDLGRIEAEADESFVDDVEDFQRRMRALEGILGVKADDDRIYNVAQSKGDSEKAEVEAALRQAEDDEEEFRRRMSAIEADLPDVSRFKTPIPPLNDDDDDTKQVDGVVAGDAEEEDFVTPVEGEARGDVADEGGDGAGDLDELRRRFMSLRSSTSSTRDGQI